MFYKNWLPDKPLDVHECFKASDSWECFKKTRQLMNDEICEKTNTLVLILDRLVANISLDNSNVDINQSMEKSVVEWQDDQQVEMCASCSKNFNITRRRHHCRTCGTILCNDCSLFLEMKSAYKIVKPKKIYMDRYDRIEENLLYQKLENCPKIRLCSKCNQLIQNRVTRIDMHYNQPIFCDVYEKLRSRMKEVEAAFEKSSQDEVELKLIEVKDEISILSGQLNKMAVSPKQEHLVKSIQLAVSNWVKDVSSKCPT